VFIKKKKLDEVRKKLSDFERTTSADRKGSLATQSLSYAVATNQILKLKGAELDIAEFFKQLNPALQKRIQNLGKPIVLSMLDKCQMI